MNKTVEIGEKLKAYFDSQGHRQQEIANRLGVSQAAVSALLNGKPFWKKLADKWGNEFGLRPAWLLTGEGQMLKSDVNNSHCHKIAPYRLVPLVNSDFFGETDDVTDAKSITRLIPFNDALETDICIRVEGYSMEPTLPCGSVVLLREVKKWREYFGYGYIFFVLLKDGRRLLKEINKSTENQEENVLCVSHNNMYSEELPKKMIDRVWKVVKILIDIGY